MSLSEKNDYIDTLKPVLYLMKMDAIIPIRFSFKDYRDNILKSKIILVISLCIYYVNLIYTVMLTYYLTDHLWRRFSMKVFIALIPSYLTKTSIFVIPWTIWSRAERMENHWAKWQTFQDEYKNLTGKEYRSDMKTMSLLSSIVILILIIVTEMMGNLNLIRSDGIAGLVSDSMNIGMAYIVGAYWFMNYMYSRTCAITIISLVKNTLTKGTNGERLNKIGNLWIKLCDLIEEFNVLHSSIFLIYTTGVVLSTILFAYISMNYSKFSDAWSKGSTINSSMVCGLMILVICEMGYSVYKQVNIRHKRTLLEYNTIQMDVEMLQSVTLLLNTASYVNPEIHLNGFFSLNRVTFLTILAICINLLIILGQFHATESIIH